MVPVAGHGAGFEMQQVKRCPEGFRTDAATFITREAAMKAQESPTEQRSFSSKPHLPGFVRALRRALAGLVASGQEFASDRRCGMALAPVLVRSGRAMGRGGRS